MMERSVDISILTNFSPLDGLKAENLHALARKTQLRELDAGRALFKEGDTDKRTFYLVSGVVELRGADDRVVGTVRAGTPEARAALAPGLPRKIHRACRQRPLVHHDRQRPARCAADLGPDRSVRGHGVERRAATRRHRRLDDDAPADQGVSSHSTGQHSSDLHAHAAHQLSRARRGDQAGHRRRLFLCGRLGQVRGHPGNAAQQGRHQARRARTRR